MKWQQIADQLISNPRTLFLVDGVGAALSAFLLGVVLVSLENSFGMPRSMLYFLAAFPCVFALYDVVCYLKVKDKYSFFLRLIAYANLFYCFISIAAAFYHHRQLTYLGWSYILLEITVIAILINIELMVATRRDAINRVSTESIPPLSSNLNAMKKIQFKHDIKASAEKVYRSMLGLDRKETYEQWTAAFSPGSTYEGSWEKGGKIYFIGTDENGKRGGMIARIADNIPNRFISIQHYGILDGEDEITEGEQVEAWAGGLENYSFEERDGVTTVTVEMQTTEEYVDFFNTTWLKALEKLREIAEE